MVVLSEVQNMFWGVTLDGGKHYTQTVERSFHISMAALEPSTDGKLSKQPVSVMIQHDKAEFMLCTLEQGKVYQQALDLNFTEGEEVTFFLNGTGIVHLTGYLVEDENMMSDMDDMDDANLSMEDMSDSDSDTAPALVGPDDDDSDETDEDEDKSPVVTVSAKKRKQEQKEKKGKKKAKVVVVEKDDDSEDDDSDDDDDDDVQFAFEDFDDDDDDDDDDEDDDELNEEIVKQITAKKVQPASTPKTGKKSGVNTPKSEVKATPQQKPEQAQNGSENTESKKKKKKKKKEENKGQTPGGPGGDSQKKDKTPKKTVLAGGTISEEVKVGHGPEARNGKMVHVYYKGTLGKSGKQFDSCSSGKPFKFRLGKKEVISGWDCGVVGMKVGGTRKLTVPPQQGYGNQRTGPIPPNSTLVFEVELKAVS